MQVCRELKRPRFEVLAFPASELEWWSCYFSIEVDEINGTDNMAGMDEFISTGKHDKVATPLTPQQQRNALRGILD